MACEKDIDLEKTDEPIKTLEADDASRSSLGAPSENQKRETLAFLGEAFEVSYEIETRNFNPNSIARFGVLDDENVLLTTSEDGTLNYAFRFYPLEPDERSLYNLIVHQAAQSSNKSVSILVYEMSETFAQSYQNGELGMDAFDGLIKRYSLKGFKRKMSRDADRCDAFCDTYEPTDGGDSGTGGTSTGGNEDPYGNGSGQTGGGGTNGYPSGGEPDDSYDPTDGSGGGGGYFEDGEDNCMDVLIPVNCTCAGHTPDEVDECKCTNKPDIILLNYCPDGGSSIGRNCTPDDCGDISGDIPLNFDACAVAAQNFINTYGLEMTVADLEAQVDGFGGACSSQEVFEEYALSSLCSFNYLGCEDVIDVSEMMEFEIFECIYNKLIKGNFSLFNKIIRPFAATTSGIDLIFKDGCNDGTAGCSERANVNDIDKGYIEIYIDSSNSSPLDMAETILHESIHAAIAAFLKAKGEVNVDLINTTRLLQLHKHYNYSNYEDHVYIGEFYIKRIARVLRKLDSNRYPEEYYYGLSYEGIEHFIPQNIQILKDTYAQYKQYNSLVRNSSSLCK